MRFECENDVDLVSKAAAAELLAYSFPSHARAYLAFGLKERQCVAFAGPYDEKSFKYSGQENVFQGTTGQKIPFAVVKRTKNISIHLTADKCEILLLNTHWGKCLLPLGRDQ